MDGWNYFCKWAGIMLLGMNIKKSIAMILIGTTMLGTVSFAASFSDVPVGTEQAEAISDLSALGVISGYGDGTFKPKDGITRAEFAKMAVVLSGQKDSVSLGGISLFKDTPDNHWANGYIRFVVSNQIILGYPTGEFMPDVKISYAEVLTIVLRLLGYTENDIGINWPNDYVLKANSLGLTDGLHYGSGDAVTREDIALLVKRALFTEMKNVTPKKYAIEMMKYSIEEDCLIIAANQQDKSLSADEVRTSGGVYKTLVQSAALNVGTICKIVLNEDKKIVAVYASKQYQKEIIVRKIMGNEMMYEGSSVPMILEDSLTCYTDGIKTTMAASKAKITEGTTITFYGAVQEVWDYALIKTTSDIKPVIARADVTSYDQKVSGLDIKDTKTATVYKNGYAAQYTDILAYDVVYYIPSTNTLEVYDKKVTGIYDKALPNKANVSSINIAGRTLEIETLDAIRMLDESAGSFKIGDRLTVLLGKDGKIAGVIGTSGNIVSYGFVASTEYAMSTDPDNWGEGEYITTIYTIEGETLQYKSLKDYKTYIGEMVLLDFSKGLLQISMAPANTTVRGSVYKDRMIIGTTKIDKDVKMIERTSRTKEKSASYQTMEFKTLLMQSLNSSDILCAIDTDNDGDMDILYLDDVTRDSYIYGILTEKKESSGAMDVRSSYTLLVGSKETTYGNIPALFTGAHQNHPVAAKMLNGTIDAMTNLMEVKSGTTTSFVYDDLIGIDGVQIPVSSDVLVYRNESLGKFSPVSYETLKTLKTTSIKVYSERAIINGGKARVILINY